MYDSLIAFYDIDHNVWAKQSETIYKKVKKIWGTAGNTKTCTLASDFYYFEN